MALETKETTREDNPNISTGNSVHLPILCRINNRSIYEMNILSRIAETLRQNRNMRATISELKSLSDHDLKDIGIERGQIEGIARGIIDIHRTVRDTPKKKD